MNPTISNVNFDHRPTDCAICRDDFISNGANDCLKLKCGHIFHTACVEQWIREQQNCPLCRKFSVLSIPESVKSILNRVKGVVIKTLNIGLTIGVTILSTMGLMAIIEIVRRVCKNIPLLPLLPTQEERDKLKEAAYQHNLKLGFNYNPITLTLKQILAINMLIPIGLAAGIGTYLFAKHYSKNRFIIDRNSAIQISYSPPAIV